MHERDAHAHLRLVLEYGNGLLTAGRIAAGAAVQLVFRLKLVGHAQDFTYLLFRGLCIPGGVVLKPLAEMHVLPHRLHLALLRRFPRNALLHVQLDLEPGNEFVIYRRSLDTSAGTHIHLDEASVNLAPGHALAQVNAVGHAMYIELAVAVALLLGCQHGAYHSVGHRIQAVDLRVKCCKWPVLTVLNDNVLFLQPLVDIIKVQHGINITFMPRILGLLFLGNARSQEHHPHVPPKLFLQKLSVGNHRGHHRRQVRYQLGIINLHQVIDAWTAGGNDVIHLMFPEDSGVFSRHEGGALRGFPHILKPKAHQSSAHLPDCLIF